MITGTYRYDLSRSSREHDRRAITELYSIPEGSRVVLFVGSRDLVDYETVDLLSRYILSHHFDVQGTSAAVSAWMQALRGVDPLCFRGSVA